MADRPVQLRQPDSDDDDDRYDSNDDNLQPENDVSSDDAGSEVESSATDPDSEQEDQDDGTATDAFDEEPEDVKDISFGALAKAQATFAPLPRSNLRKRKLASLDSAQQQPPQSPSESTDRPMPQKKPRQELAHRTSKHAPTVLSSRYQVSRKRTIFSPPPNTQSRDPRFDPTITSQTLNENSVAAASKAYSFLTDYQASEILQLKSEIKKASIQGKNYDPARADTLRKQVMSMESRLRNIEIKSKEREILQRHNQQEKEAIRQGKKSKAFFLKKSDIRKEIEREKLEGMGKKARDKTEKRKRMREKRKDARDMPWARRMG